MKFLNNFIYHDLNYQFTRALNYKINSFIFRCDLVYLISLQASFSIKANNQTYCIFCNQAKKAIASLDDV